MDDVDLTKYRIPIISKDSFKTEAKNRLLPGSVNIFAFIFSDTAPEVNTY